MAGMAGRTFQLKYTIPNMELTLTNEREVVKKMTREVFKLIKRRTLAGLDSSNKPFARPKAGGVALEETGQLKRSIGFRVRKAGGRKSKKTGKTSRVHYRGVVRCRAGRRRMGGDELKRRRRRKKTRTAEMRADAIADFARGIVRGDLGARVSKKTGKLAIGRVGRHAITDNAHLAAVLSTEPKGADPSKGRALYRIFEANKAEIAAATRALRLGGKFKLRATRRKRKRGS